MCEKGSEIDYLKKFASEWTEMKNSEDKLKLEKFYYDHPKFQDLVKSRLFMCHFTFYGNYF